LLFLWLVYCGWLFQLKYEEVLSPVNFVFGLFEDHVSEKGAKLFLGDGDTLNFMELFGGVKVDNGSALKKKLNGFLEEYFILVWFRRFLQYFSGG
jgi:hypothetical protein